MLIETTLAQMTACEYGDWPHVFAYANGEEGSPEKIPGEDTDTSVFGLTDVKAIFGSVDGENDGPSWVAVGQLNDGRYFSIRASCDYTGWG